MSVKRVSQTPRMNVVAVMLMRPPLFLHFALVINGGN